MHLNGAVFLHNASAISWALKRLGDRCWKTGTGNLYVPDDLILIDLSFELLIDRCLDIENCKHAGDIEEDGSHSKVSSGAYPASRKPYSRHQ